MGLFRKNTHHEAPPTDARVSYSTRFGGTREGEQKLFLLQRDGAS